MYLDENKILKKIKAHQESTVYGFIQSYINSLQFNKGDYLIRISRYMDIEYITKINGTNIIRKYQVVYIDENDVRYCSYVKVDGSLSSEIFPLIDMNHSCFKLDPDYLNSMLIGYDYDPLHEYKKHKEQKEHEKRNKS